MLKLFGTSSNERPPMTLPRILVRTLAVAAPAVAGAVLLAAPSSAQAPTSEVLPGYWEYTTSALGDRDTLQRCVRPAEINRFFGGLSTRRYSCTYPVREVGGGNANFRGNCTGVRDGRRIRVHLTGTYRPESFQFQGGVSIRAAGIWLPSIPASITARRISAVCPANAVYF